MVYFITFYKTQFLKSFQKDPQGHQVRFFFLTSNSRHFWGLVVALAQTRVSSLTMDADKNAKKRRSFLGLKGVNEFGQLRIGVIGGVDFFTWRIGGFWNFALRIIGLSIKQGAFGIRKNH